MKEQPTIAANADPTPAQQTLAELRDQHMRSEFVTNNVEETMDTMVEEATVNHVPVLTGGVGSKQVQAFYNTHFIPQLPPDMTMTPISRTIGTDRLVDEMIVQFTHTIQKDWILPGVPPTGKQLEIPMAVVVKFREGSWPQKASTGIKPACSSSSACPTPRPSMSRTLRVLARFSIQPYLSMP